jgi:hypothetical protein
MTCCNKDCTTIFVSALSYTHLVLHSVPLILLLTFPFCTSYGPQVYVIHSPWLQFHLEPSATVKEVRATRKQARKFSPPSALSLALSHGLILTISFLLPSIHAEYGPPMDSSPFGVYYCLFFR